jgi:hypothetical protein
MTALHDICRGADGRYLAARYHDIVCYYDVNHETDENFRAFVRWSEKLLTIWPRGTGTAIWVDGLAARHPPGPQVRKAYAELAARRSDRQFARVSIIQAEGILGATVRSVLTGLNLLRRTTFPQYVSHDSLDGIRWLCARLPVDPTRPSPEEIHSFFQQTLSDYRKSEVTER